MLSADSATKTTEAFSIPAPDGRLAAVLHPAAGGVPGHVLVICHGFRGSKEGGGRAAALAAQAAACGFAVVRFDFTPLSPLSRQVAEVAAAVRYCRGRFAPAVILLGRSMGGAAALAYSAGDASIAGLCLWSTPHDLAETFRLALGDGYTALEAGEEVDVSDEWGQVRLTPELIRDFPGFDLLGAAAAFAGRPLLVVHGENDAIVPVRQARELFARAGQPKELAVIVGGDHQFLTVHPQAARAVTDWLCRTFVPAGGCGA